jgi:cobaltochelatase CobS
MLILDEIDAAEPNALMSLQMVLERGQIFIPEINKLISRTSCIISATANTNGWGDETGLHAGTSCQNFATFDRFQMVRDCDYNEATEKKLLKKNFEELLGTEVLKKLWEIFSHIRKDFKDGLVITPLSLRQMNAACSLAPIFGIRRACEVAMLGKASPADKANILAVVRRISET